MADQTNTPTTSELEPGSLAWRIAVAKAAHEFFNPVSPKREAIAQLINKPLNGVPYDAWTVNDLINYILALGMQPGEATMISRLVAAMERAGLLMRLVIASGVAPTPPRPDS